MFIAISSGQENKSGHVNQTLFLEGGGVIDKLEIVISIW